MSLSFPLCNTYVLVFINFQKSFLISFLSLLVLTILSTFLILKRLPFEGEDIPKGRKISSNTVI